MNFQKAVQTLVGNGTPADKCILQIVQQLQSVDKDLLKTAHMLVLFHDQDEVVFSLHTDDPTFGGKAAMTIVKGRVGQFEASIISELKEEFEAQGLNPYYQALSESTLYVRF